MSSKETKKIESIDLAVAKNRSYVFLLDLSLSMLRSDETTLGKRRWEVAQDFMAKIMEFIETFQDTVGVTVIAFGGKDVTVINDVTTSAIESAIMPIVPKGGTPLFEALNVLFSLKKDGTLKKDVIAFVLTDGEPTSGPEEKVGRAIAEWTKSTEKRDMSIHFIQVGNDRGAKLFLERLQPTLDAHGAAFECVTSGTITEAEFLSPANLLWKAEMLGG